jgi:hypothetical protein
VSKALCGEISHANRDLDDIGRVERAVSRAESLAIFLGGEMIKGCFNHLSTGSKKEMRLKSNEAPGEITNIILEVAEEISMELKKNIEERLHGSSSFKAENPILDILALQHYQRVRKLPWLWTSESH